jgi:TatD DNase family protein
VGGVLTYKKAGELPQVVQAAPLERLVLETDCPYLPPVPHRGKRNEPSYIPLVAAQMAALRGTDITEIAAGTTAAAREIFRLPTAL